MLGSLWDQFGGTLGSLSLRCVVTLRGVWGHGGFISGSIWNHVGITLRLRGEHFGVNVGALWCMFGITLPSLWDQFTVALGSLWDNLGVTMFALWGHFGVTLGSLLAYIGITVRGVPSPLRLRPCILSSPLSRRSSTSTLQPLCMRIWQSLRWKTMVGLPRKSQHINTFNKTANRGFDRI